MLGVPIFFLNFIFLLSDTLFPFIWQPCTQTTRRHIHEDRIVTLKVVSTYVCILLHLCHENKEAVWTTCTWISLEDIIDFHSTLRSVVQSVPHILVTAYFIELSRDQKPTGLQQPEICCTVLHAVSCSGVHSFAQTHISAKFGAACIPTDGLWWVSIA